MVTGVSQELTPRDEVVRRRATLVLRSGFLITAFLVAAGSFLALVKREPLPHTIGNPADILRDVASGDPGSVVGLGIVTVILTPLAMAGVTCLTYARRGEYRQAGINGVVLAILLVSVLLSIL